MEDMSPEPGLAESWETSDDGLTWTFDIREGVMWSDGEPLTAADIAYTYSRIIDGGPEAATWGSYLTSVDERRGAGRHHGRADAREAQRGPPAAADPDRARARLVEHRREGGQDLRRRADRRPAGRRVRARSGWSRAPPAARRTASSATPTTGRARPTSTRSSSASTRPRTRWSRRWSRARSTSPRGSPPSRCDRWRARTASPRRTATRPASTRSRSTPAPSTSRPRQPIGDGHPALKDPRLPLRAPASRSTAS